MSTPEQPDTPPLTRKQLREIRHTGAIPTLDGAMLPAGDLESPMEDGPADDAPIAPPPVDASFPPVASLPLPAEPVVLPEPPSADGSVDLDVAPLTRRQAREQERIRTASVPVITPEIAAAYAAQSGPPSDPTVLVEQPEIEESVVAEGEQAGDDGSPRVVDPTFGAALLAGQVAPADAFAPSFDELVTRSGNGSVATPNAIILSQSPDGGPIVAPVTATGEVLITGTFNLPEGLGSTGHAPGAADGKDVDAVLIDGELPAHSSPTPIAASAAISTVKTPGEIIKPPAPEKGGRLMLTLAITAGVLALALVGVLILAFATGVFR